MHPDLPTTPPETARAATHDLYVVVVLEDEYATPEVKFIYGPFSQVNAAVAANFVANLTGQTVGEGVQTHPCRRWAVA